MATEETKQIKVIGFYLTIVITALIFAMYKSCDHGCDPNTSSCRDEFIPESSSSMSCQQGAVAEIVTEPKKGIMCHCRHGGGPNSKNVLPSNSGQ